MDRFLVIDDDPAIREVLGESLRELLGIEVEVAPNGGIGAQMLLEGRFSFALIDAILPDASGVALAALAANQNVATLLISGHPGITDELATLGFPHLAKPFKVDTLMLAAAQVMRDAEDNIRRVKASAEAMRERVLVLERALVESRRLLAATIPLTWHGVA